MASCTDYEGSYTVTQTSCAGGCTIPPGAHVAVVCSPAMTFQVNGTPHAAAVNAIGQLEVPALELVASITGSVAQRYLFGVTQPAAQDSGGTEVWGADEG